MTSLDPRRRVLLRALAAGLTLAGGGFRLTHAEETLFGGVPHPLSAGKSLYRIRGEVRVNDKIADESTRIRANDTITTEDDSEAIFVVGQDAFFLRQKSELQLTGREKLQARLRQRPLSSPPTPTTEADDSGVVESFRLVTGGLLTVFGKSDHKASTSTATVGIRGTGVYFESEPHRSYVCTCYGTTLISASDDPASSVKVKSQHHDAAKYIYRGDDYQARITAAPFKNHEDLELMILEALVGRTPPFAVAGEAYGAPRREY
ncbi:MAG: hypothetical protein HQL48_00075 [Gammaproteobacteria bacterium]|nr:hypothetical protein [Gammaproteobacteria bacterium]